MKSVKSRIITVICALVALSLLTLGVVSIVLNFQTTSGVLEQALRQTAIIASNSVSNQLRIYKTIVANAGMNEDICNPDASIEQKQQALDDVIGEYADLTRGNILDADGNSIFNGTNYSERDYYQNAIKGISWVSDPLVSKVTGAVTIIVAAPIWENGTPGSKIIGVVYFVPVETFLNDIAAQIKISDNAGAQIINKAGTVVAHPNMDFVSNYNNNQENEKTDSSYTSIAALERRMMQGESGFGSYTMLGVDKVMAYAPIADSGGWSIGVNAPIGDFMEYTNRSILYTVIALVVFLIASVIFALSTANSIGKPLRYLADMLSNVAKTGSIHLDDTYKQNERVMKERKDEIGFITTASGGLIAMLAHDAEVLSAIADGDLSVEVRPLSENDVLGNAMERMTSNLNDMFYEINNSSTRVSSGARQIADGSQTLAQGSTQQAASVEQLSSAMSAISDKTKQNAEMAEKASALGNTIKENAEKGNRQMNEMMRAVRDISQASQSINKVIKVVDDIAFQTNILALNAAVEAARAGQHGKGFAVVAEEVRNLASKSAEAARDTGGLIANSMEKSEFGARIADETAASLEDIVAGINESSQLVSKIAKSSGEQFEGIAQVNKGIDQVAQVAQQNSATSEESASASEEMSGQAAALEKLVERFKLKDSNTARSRLTPPPPPAPSKRLSMPDKPSASTFSAGDYGKY